MDVLVGRGIGEARVCCVHVSVCVCVCVSIYRAYIYMCASFQKRVRAFFEGYSDEDARYVRVYAVHREI